MITVLFADGFEEVEALTPVDILRREGHEVVTVGITGKTVTGSHGISIICDKTFDEVDISLVDMAIFPGGMPGAVNLDASPFTSQLIGSVLSRGGRIAAICAAPLIFGRRGLLEGRNAICFPGFEHELKGAKISSRPVVTDGQITTARGMDVSLEFANELAELLRIEKQSDCAASVDTPDFSSYSFPSCDGFPAPEVLASEEIEEEIVALKEKILTTLSDYNEPVAISSVTYGPRIIRFSVTPIKKKKRCGIPALAFTLALHLMRDGIVILPSDTEGELTIDIPHTHQRAVFMREMLESEEFSSDKRRDAVCIGVDIDGHTVTDSISEMSHAIVAGATGMGKSVFVHSLITSILFKARPDEIKLVLIDPKMVELQEYKGLTHLASHILTSHAEAMSALEWAYRESNRRKMILSALGADSIEAYNDKTELKLPRIVFVIDELADLMLISKSKSESAIVKLLESAHTVGIHLIICTQRPSTNVLTGRIRSNTPTRVCFKTASNVDSRTVIEKQGAESLSSKGDMLYLKGGKENPIHLQSAYISSSSVEGAVNAISSIYGTNYIAELEDAVQNCRKLTPENSEPEKKDQETQIGSNEFLSDELFLAVAEFTAARESVSTALLQRRFSIGYGKAIRFIDAMCALGLISEPEGQKPRKVLAGIDEWKAAVARIKRNDPGDKS